MSLSKRSSNEVVLPDIETKKLRKSITVENERRITSIEDLPNEIFYELFEYFDGCDIYYTFSNLNIRFNNLFNHSLLPIKIYRSTSFNRLSDEDYRQFLIDNRHRIISLYTKTSSIKPGFSLLFMANIISFDRLESLIIENNQYFMAELFLRFVTNLSGLLSLKINVDEDVMDWNKLYPLILRLPNLKYNKLSLSVPFYAHPSTVKIDIISSLERLVIDHMCDLNNLLTILIHTPCLTHLTCSRLNPPHERRMKLSLNNTSLKYVCIKECAVKFDDFDILVQNFFSKLQILKFSTSVHGSYVNGTRWEGLISKRIPDLQIFNLKYSANHQSIILFFPSLSNFNRFSSSFWIEHKWFCELQVSITAISTSLISYCVQPFKKQWYQLPDELNFHPMINGSTSTNNSFSCFHLIVDDFQLFGHSRIYEDHLKIILNQMQFTNLHIDLARFSISFLLHILHLLPNLDSLTITSIHPETTKILSKEQNNMFNLISTQNKITKLNLEQMSEIDQVHVLISLCRNIHHFQVKCRNIFDAKWLLQYVITNRNRNLLPNLRLITICLMNADDQITNDLQTVIDTQKLIDDYMIKRICDRIYIRWNE